MRDAFGGAFMIKLFLVFIIIYVGFTAVALNYAKAFKVKNKVIEYIEENEIVAIDRMSAAEFKKMDEYFEKELLGKMHYQAMISCTEPTDGRYSTYEVQYCDKGIKIVKTHYTKANKLGDYYTVYTTFGWSIPFINSILRLNDQDGAVTRGLWVIKGETRPLVNE